MSYSTPAPDSAPPTLSLASSASSAAALLLATAVALAAPAAATTYVMTTDRELVERSELAVLANVISVEPTPGAARPSTDYLIEIEQVAKGYVPSSTLLVRAPGGVDESGLAMRVFGLPRLVEGDRVLLFLAPGEAGAWQLSELGLGIFFTARVGEHEYAFRALGAGANVVSRPGDGYAAERADATLPRHLDGFVDWIRDHGAAPRSAPAPDYYLSQPSAGVVAAQAPFTLLRSGGGCGATAGNPARWFEFDLATNVRFFADSAGQPNVPGNNGLNSLGQAFNAWNQVNGSSISLRYAGTTTNTGPAVSLPLDGLNTILFEDDNGEINGSFNGSGTLAVGTIFFLCGVQPFVGVGGAVAHAILEAGIVFQDGAGANFFAVSTDPGSALLEVLTHELGHTLGIGHSCGDSSSPGCSGVLDDAIMRAFVHDDGRGARLNSDDRAAALALYTQATGNPPNPPTLVTAEALSTSEIEVAWSGGSANVTSYEVEERSAGGEFAPIATLPSSASSLVVESLPEATFREYRVRGRNGQGPSPYSPTAGATTNGTVGPCNVDAETLCLNQERFQVTSSFETGAGVTGNGQRGEITDDTGYFWFFQDTNVEIVIKVLGACGINSRYWVFAGGLTNVEAVLTVVDKQTGEANTYFNPQGAPFQPIQDTDAFETCP